jgi:DNA polymerase elongation subunit (family B)
MSQKLKKRMITLKTLSLPNQFFVLVKDYISSQEIIFDHNKRKEFECFLKEIKYVAGFEIRQDLNLIAMWLAGGVPQSMYQYKMNLENGGKTTYPRKYDFFAIDIKYLHRFHKRNLALRYAGANINVPQLYQQIPKSFDDKFIQDSLHSCMIDVNIIHNILEYSIGMIKARRDISKDFKMYLLDNSASRIADKILKAEYIHKSASNVDTRLFHPISKSEDNDLKKSIKIKDLIDSRIYFDKYDLNNFFEDIKENTLADKYEYSIKIGDTAYRFKSGGLHSIDTPQIFESDAENVYINIDASSFYATLLTELNITPANLNSEIFQNAIKKLLDSRIKNINDEEKSKLYKDVLTSIIGKFISTNPWLYDPKSYYKITINGQLIMLMLISLLEENGLKVVYCNTDELVVKTPRNRVSFFIDLIDAFRKNNTNIRFKTKFCVKFIVKESTNTLRLFYGGKIKRTGIFDYSLWVTKKLNAPIISKALEQILLYGVDIDEFFENNKKIYDYCYSVNINKEQVLKVSGVYDGKVLMNTLKNDFVRYYITNKGGYSLILDDAGKETVISKDKIKIANNIYSSYTNDIDINYYKKEVNKILELFKVKQLELF